MKATIWSTVALVLVVSAGKAGAHSSGIYDQARAGCTCHGGLLDNQVTQLQVDGLPSGGYVSGTPYTLTIWVLGAPIPLPVFAGENLRGFNLEATAGSLAPLDSSVQLASECLLLAQVTACNPASSCGVRTEDPDTTCTNGFDCYTRYCSTPGTSGCRPCSTLVFPQATHTSLNGFGPAAGTAAELVTDGNSVLVWRLQWTAPAAGVGDVSLYLAGNVVNGNGAADRGDVWSALPSPIVVHQAAP
jgi:hypothetical protein